MPSSAEAGTGSWKRISFLLTIGIVVLIFDRQFNHQQGVVYIHQHEVTAKNHSTITTVDIANSSLHKQLRPSIGSRPGTILAASYSTNASPSAAPSSTVDEKNSAAVVTVNNLEQETPVSALRAAKRDRDILFVHIGKAGGVSVERSLYTHCDDFPKISNNETLLKECLDGVENSTLARLTRHTLHVPGNQDYNKRRDYIEGPNCTTFLYVLRHPVDRAVSAFWYRYPLKRCSDEQRRDGSCKRMANLDEKLLRFYTCFPAVEDFAQALSLNYNQSSPCPDLALRSMTGNINPNNESDVTWDDLKKVDHLNNYNYRYFCNYTMFPHPEREVLSVRTHNMWDDLSNLDVWLGGTGNLGQAAGTHHTHGSEEVVDKSPLTPEGSKLLCCGLLEEMHIYRNILFRSDNLPDAVKKETWKQDLAVCGTESLHTLAPECESLIDMKQLRAHIVERWGDTFLEDVD